MSGVQPREQLLQRACPSSAAAVATGRYQLLCSRGGQLVQQDVAEQTAAESDDDADQRHPEQVDAAFLEAAGEHRALQRADADRGEVCPERDRTGRRSCLVPREADGRHTDAPGPASRAGVTEWSR